HTYEIRLIDHIVNRTDQDFRRCSCSRETLLLTTYGPGSWVEEWTILTWTIIRQWKPCDVNEYICDIRFAHDGRQIGMTVEIRGQSHQFQLRDRSMINTLNRITFSNSFYPYFLLSLSNGQWMTHEYDNRQLYIIDKGGKLEQTVTCCDDKYVRSIALSGCTCLAVLTRDKELCLYDL
ncbi:unnamed protein product, partial [Didymodactylos carnosus]